MPFSRRSQLEALRLVAPRWLIDSSVTLTIEQPAGALPATTSVVATWQVAHAAGRPAQSGTVALHLRGPIRVGQVELDASDWPDGAVGVRSSVEDRTATATIGVARTQFAAVTADRDELRAWIDDNLPPLVERLVREEIQRISRAQ